MKKYTISVSGQIAQVGVDSVHKLNKVTNMKNSGVSLNIQSVEICQESQGIER